jgi:hypothetical protein
MRNYSKCSTHIDCKRFGYFLKRLPNYRDNTLAINKAVGNNLIESAAFLQTRKPNKTYSDLNF